MTKNQSIGDINQIYAMTQRDGAEFRLASIPASFTVRARTVRPRLHEGAVRGRLQARRAGRRLGPHAARGRDHRAAVSRQQKKEKAARAALLQISFCDTAYAALDAASLASLVASCSPRKAMSK